MENAWAVQRENAGSSSESNHFVQKAESEILAQTWPYENEGSSPDIECIPSQKLYYQTATSDLIVV